MIGGQVDLCPQCGNPAHAGESDDFGRHLECFGPRTRLTRKRPRVDHYVVPEPTTPPIDGAVLRRDALYMGDNGRIFCFAHAGSSALRTGRDISGQRVIIVMPADAAEWMKEIGEPIQCEDCRLP